MTLAELHGLRDRLEEARFSGHRSVRYQDWEETYKSDAEMAEAIRALDARIAELSGQRRVTTVRLSTSKGL